jgi:hypothetical protein
MDRDFTSRIDEHAHKFGAMAYAQKASCKLAVHLAGAEFTSRAPALTTAKKYAWERFCCPFRSTKTVQQL